MILDTLCTPVIIQIFFFFLFLVSYVYLIVNDFSQYNTVSFLFNLLDNVLWTWLIYYLCSVGYMFIAWFLVLFPFIIILLVLIGYIFSSLSSNPTQTPSLTQSVPLNTAAAIATAQAAITAARGTA